eukprot:gene8892-3775_t
MALSTRPEGYLGELELWNKAEEALTAALNTTGLPWTINEGDGAFYGPKIDITVYDALKRKFQCATVQLDFQLPIRFNLEYITDTGSHERPVIVHRAILGSVEGIPDPMRGQSSSTTGSHERPVIVHRAILGSVERMFAILTLTLTPNLNPTFTQNSTPTLTLSLTPNSRPDPMRGQSSSTTGSHERPVIVHRAILGSVERMFAILTEHYAGKWPLWLNPRQVMVVPITSSIYDYCQDIRKTLRAAGIHCDVDASNNKMQKKVREAQLSQYNYIFVVGEEEQKATTVNVRTRDNVVHGMHKLEDVVTILREEQEGGEAAPTAEAPAAEALAADE